ncbi:MAG: methyltransferase RsmF C-terminal domain-like protein [Candidatus Asgardarchaeia archaeon]
MPSFERMTKRQRKDILKILKENFGFEELPYILLSSGKRRIWICPPDVAKINFKGLYIHSIGLYFANYDRGILRLSFDATQVFSKDIKKNIIEVNKEEAEKWMLGESLPVRGNLEDNQVVVVKYNNDFLGCGIVKNNRILNHVPKDRRTLTELTKELEFP